MVAHLFPWFNDQLRMTGTCRNESWFEDSQAVNRMYLVKSTGLFSKSSLSALSFSSMTANDVLEDSCMENKFEIPVCFHCQSGVALPEVSCRPIPRAW